MGKYQKQFLDIEFEINKNKIKKTPLKIKAAQRYFKLKTACTKISRLYKWS